MEHQRNHQFQNLIEFLGVASRYIEDHGPQYQGAMNSGHTKISNNQHETHCTGGRTTLVWEGGRKQTSATYETTKPWGPFVNKFPLKFEMKIMLLALGASNSEWNILHLLIFCFGTSQNGCVCVSRMRGVPSSAPAQKPVWLPAGAVWRHAG